MAREITLVRRSAVSTRLATALVVVVGLAIAWLLVHQAMPGWYARLWYPLHYERAIVDNAGRNGLDPALVAAVIETESGFVPDSRSSQGAVGLMQLLPATARFVAEGPDRPSPGPARLEDPEVNIAYGTRYLRYLIDRHGTLPLALAAYNGGEANVERWEAEAAAEGRTLRVPEDVPFPETRAFVGKVLDLRGIYRRTYADRLAPSG
jgi:soluble lytic murein transglycosylase